MSSVPARSTGIVAALLASPLLGWCAAIATNRAGLAIAPALIFGGVVLLLGLAGAIWFVARTELPGPRLLLGSGAFLVASLFIYGCLAAAPDLPEEFANQDNRPSRAITRTPRELALECTKDPEFGRAGQWPDSGLSAPTDGNWTEFVRTHAEAIDLAWVAVAVPRNWMRRVIAYEGYDDFCERPDSPLLAFDTVRDLITVQGAYIRLVLSRGKVVEAAHEYREQLRLVHHLREGSRCVVTRMIGNVAEVHALELAESQLAGNALPAELVVVLREHLGGPERDRLDRRELARVLRSEASIYTSRPPTPEEFNGVGMDQVPRHLLRNPLLFNFRDSSVRYHQIAAMMSADLNGERTDFPRAWSERYIRESSRLSFKNPCGAHFLAWMWEPFAKVAAIELQLIERRAALREKLRAAPEPAPK